MSWVSVRRAAELVADGAVEVNVTWLGEAADVDSVPALRSAIAGSEIFKNLHVLVQETQDAAAKALAAALLDMTTLDLRCNRFTDVGVSALASVVEKSPSITTLGLTNNPITEVSAIILASAVEMSQSMTTVQLQSNQITDAGHALLLSCPLAPS